MKIAAIYDIHGNLPALQAVLKEVENLGVDQMVIGGDVVPGPQSRECLELIIESNLEKKFVRGNGERNIALLSKGGNP